MGILDNMNRPQREAITTTEGAVLVIAGAGSGKTRVLTHRIAYLIQELGVKPYNILAITFTNKAAAEMRERVDKVVGQRAGEVWVSTFHSTCVRILRRYGDRLGFSNNFTIYDSDDQKNVVKEICKKLNIDTKMIKERTILATISNAKDAMTTPEEMLLEAGGDYFAQRVAAVYKEYQKALKLNNAMDFDDLIYNTVTLFEHNEDVLNYYQDRFHYIMVDEYQDTNGSQFKLISMLVAKYGNLCVVGDDDQSIYRFRGADIRNILDFETMFSGAKVIKLEQNYRSTQNILDAANAVISNNIGRKTKSLWTEEGAGEKIHFSLYGSDRDEAEGIANSIASNVRDGWDYNDCAILYRTNAQSRSLEEKLITRNIPYRIFGGVNFYQRKEIKDILAYLKTIANGTDAQAVKRIINVPKRGIGDTTIDRVQEYADFNEISFWDALTQIDSIEAVKRGAAKLKDFVSMIEEMRDEADDLSVKELIEYVIDRIGYYEYLEETEEQDKVDARIENIEELINKAVSFMNSCEEEEKDPSLNGFLEDVALIADIDNLEESDNHVVLMTLHSAKGLEFPLVYLAGMEDGLFPGYMSITSDDPIAIEEERRLAYVGITRAKKELYLSAAKTRMVRGEMQMNKISRFVEEIPKHLLDSQRVDGGYTTKNIGKENFRISDLEDDFGSTSKRYDARANTKAALARFGVTEPVKSNNGFYKSPTGRVRIGNNTKSTGQYSGVNSFNSSNNEKVGFGKAFPMDAFDLKKESKDNKDTSDSFENPLMRALKDAKHNKATASDNSSNKALGTANTNKASINKNSVSKANADNATFDNAHTKGLGYKKGDIVRSMKFGEGKVLVIEASGTDYKVTVDFDNFGIKVMLAGFAKLSKVD